MLHGIKRESKVKEGFGERSGIKKIIFCYKDGRAYNVVPDSGKQTFSEDDIKELKEILDKASAVLEWDEVSARGSEEVSS